MRSSPSAVVLAGLALFLGGLLPVLTAASAHAHAGLAASNPAGDSVVDALPSAVVLTFSEDVADLAYVVVTGPAGPVGSGEPAVDGPRVTQALDPRDAAPGAYQVEYRVVSADGHPIMGEVRFAFEPSAPDAGPATAGPPAAVPSGRVTLSPADVASSPEPEGGSSSSAVVTAGFVAAVLTLGTAGWLARRPRRAP